VNVQSSLFTEVECY